MSPTSKISRWWLLGVLAIICPAAAAWAQRPATRPAPLSHIQIDARKKQIRVQCIEVNAQMPLEFFCVTDGGPEHETVLRTAARPSEIHFGLLALGLTPGEPAHFVEATSTWYAPTGPPLKITCEFERDGKAQSVPAERMMRSMKTKQPMPPATWVFDGSRILPDGQYAADITGYVVSIVNFDLTMIDVPQLASNSNETLEWEFNPDVCPKKGAAVTMIIEPVPGGSATRPAQSRPADQFNPGPGLHEEVSGAASRP
ncbi:MAG: YdjY domain-containing protein [Tepidisphaeraceae bacterium]